MGTYVLCQLSSAYKGDADAYFHSVLSPSGSNFMLIFVSLSQLLEKVNFTCFGITYLVELQIKQTKNRFLPTEPSEIDYVVAFSSANFVRDEFIDEFVLL